MISKGSIYESAVLANGREWRTEVTVTNGVTTETYDGCEVTVKQQFADSDGISVGGAFSTEISLNIKQPMRTLDYLNSTYTIRVGLKLVDTDHTWGSYSDDTWASVLADPNTDTWGEMGNGDGMFDVYSYVPIGTFYPASMDDTGREISLTLYDKIAQLDEVWDYGNLAFPSTTTAVATALCSAYGLTQKSALANSYTVSGIPENSTARQVLAWLAGTVGANAIINYDGQLEWRTYNFTSCWTIDRDHELLDETHIDGTYTINSVTMGYEDAVYVYGTGTGITIENPWADQTMCNRVGAVYANQTFYTGEVEWFGNPEIELGDTATVKALNNRTGATYDALFPVCNNEWKLMGGLNMVTTCSAVADADYNFSTALSPSEVKLKQMKSDVEQFRADLQQQIDGATGGIFTLTDSNNDGINDGFTIADNTNLSQATNIIKASSAGIGISTDGGQTYQTAITGEGIYGTAIKAGTLTADQISSTTKGDIVSSTVVQYYLSTSSSSPTGGSWSTTAPSWVNGKYMWQRTLVTYMDGNTEYKPSSTGTCVSGAKGEKGDDGTGISVKANASACTTIGDAYIDQTTGHLMILTTLPSTFTDGGQVKGADGADGADGVDGVSVTGIQEYYAVSSSNTTAPSTWYTDVQTMTSSNKYLWNKERCIFSDGTYGAYTTPCVIGVYGDTGSTGKGISDVEEQYAVSSSNTTAPTSWSSAPVTTTTSNKYLWSRERVVYTDGTYSDWTTACVIGTHGATGETGATGAKGDAGEDGVGVNAITAQYYLSTSSTTQSDGSWVTTCPTWSSGKYLWFRYEISYSDGTTAYTTAHVDTSWAKAVEVQNETVVQTQVVYYQSASGVDSLEKPTSWITSTSDTYQTWTTVCPTYRTAYPVTWQCTQSKLYDGSYSTSNCTTPSKNNMTAIIDGSHISCGTIDCGVVTVTNIDASEIKSGTLDCDNLTVTNLDLSGTFTTESSTGYELTFNNGKMFIGQSDGSATSGAISSGKINHYYSNSDYDTIRGLYLTGRDTSNNVLASIIVGKVENTVGTSTRGAISIQAGNRDASFGDGSGFRTKRGYESLLLNQCSFDQFADPPYRFATSGSSSATRLLQVGQTSYPTYNGTHGDGTYAVAGKYYYGTGGIGDLNECVTAHASDGGKTIRFNVPLGRRIHAYQKVQLDAMRINGFCNGDKFLTNTVGGYEVVASSQDVYTTCARTTTATGTAVSYITQPSAVFVNSIGKDHIEVSITRKDGGNFFSTTVSTDVCFPVTIYQLWYTVTDYYTS